MKKKLHAKGCVEGDRCIECQDVERYVFWVKEGMTPEEAQRQTALAVKNRTKLNKQITIEKDDLSILS